MNKNFIANIRSAIILVTLILFFSYSGKGQLPPQLKFINPLLVSGTDGQVGATYKFLNVNPNIDAYITIENIVGGAVLRNIDNTSTGYDNAWQPIVGGPGTYGSSYIKWDVRFDSAGASYMFSKLNLSAIDVDGDNVRVRELSGINGGQGNYSVPTQVPSLLTISTIKDTDNTYGTDLSDSNLIALGPVINRTGIDTLSQDVRIDYKFTNKSEFKIYTGSQVDSNGNAGAIATDRFHCIYFGNITGTYTVLKETNESFTAINNNNIVNLSWAINTAIINLHFEIERSFNGADFFTRAVIVKPDAVNGGRDEYSYTDNDPELLHYNIVYYRLKQTDVNADNTYSVIKTVHISNVAAESIDLQVKPNPYTDKLNIGFYSEADGTAEIRMINLSGMVVKKMESTISKGFNTLDVKDLGSLFPGIYIVSIVVNGKMTGIKKIIKN